MTNWVGPLPINKKQKAKFRVVVSVWGRDVEVPGFVTEEKWVSEDGARSCFLLLDTHVINMGVSHSITINAMVDIRTALDMEAIGSNAVYVDLQIRVRKFRGNPREWKWKGLVSIDKKFVVAEGDIRLEIVPTGGD